MIDFFKRLRQLLRRAVSLLTVYNVQPSGDYKHAKVLTGTMLAQLNNTRAGVRDLSEVEFQVFSQFGDDGIIQWLVHKLEIQERTFIEFGVQDYTESNTRFLLVKDKWSGIVIDGNAVDVDYISKDPVSTLFDLRPINAFITAENVNELIAGADMVGRIGLLSIDIDGMDYWIWNAVECVDPAIVIVEYNSGFGPQRAITVPYKPDFDRAVAHHSRLYWGASIVAFQDLANAKGYGFIGCNANGNNAYFVRNEYMDMPEITLLRKTYKAASFSEYAENGRPLRGAKAVEFIAGKTVYNTRLLAHEPL